MCSQDNVKPGNEVATTTAPAILHRSVNFPAFTGDINSYLANPEDAADEHINRSMYALGDALKTIAITPVQSRYINEQAARSPVNSILLTDLFHVYPELLTQVNGYLASNPVDNAANFAQLVTDLVYDVAYQPTIHVPNIRTLSDYTGAPVFSPGTQIDELPDDISDAIFAWDVQSDGTARSIAVNKTLATDTDRPIFAVSMIDGQTLAHIAAGVQYEPFSFASSQQIGSGHIGTPEAKLEAHSNEFTLKKRFESDNNSELNVAFVQSTVPTPGVGASTTVGYAQNGIFVRSINKSKINQQQSIWQYVATDWHGNAATGTLVTNVLLGISIFGMPRLAPTEEAIFNFYEDDWINTAKNLGIMTNNGRGIDGTRKYLNEWYAFNPAANTQFTFNYPLLFDNHPAGTWSVNISNGNADMTIWRVVAP